MLSMVAMGRMLRHLPDHYNLQKRETPRRSCESEMHTFLATESPKILRMALCGYVGLRSKVILKPKVLLAMRIYRAVRGHRTYKRLLNGSEKLQCRATLWQQTAWGLSSREATGLISRKQSSGFALLQKKGI